MAGWPFTSRLLQQDVQEWIRDGETSLSCCIATHSLRPEFDQWEKFSSFMAVFTTIWTAAAAAVAATGKRVKNNPHKSLRAQ